MPGYANHKNVLRMFIFNSIPQFVQTEPVEHTASVRKEMWNIDRSGGFHMAGKKVAVMRTSKNQRVMWVQLEDGRYVRMWLHDNILTGMLFAAK